MDSILNFRFQRPVSYRYTIPQGSAGIVAGPLAGRSIAGASDLEAIQLDEPLLGLGVDVGDHLDVGLEAGAAKLSLQQAVDLEDARRVVHQDLDQDRPLLAVADRDVL